MICNRVAMSWSPVVARRSLSHVTAMVCSAEVARTLIGCQGWWSKTWEGSHRYEGQPEKSAQ